MIDSVLGYLKEGDIEYKENVKMSAITSVRIGGTARIVAAPSSVEKLASLCRFLRKCNIKHKIIGRMTNLLPPDEGYDGALISTARLNRVSFDGDVITAYAGVPLPLLAYKAAVLSRGGLSQLSGIPGSLGGAITGNAGAYGREIGDLVRSADVLDLNENEIITLDRDELDFQYRKSLLKNGRFCLLSAKLMTVDSDKDAETRLIDFYRKKRLEAQPSLPSLGSVFKRCHTVSASRLIDECGLKGLSVGGASVSLKHAGFIVNNGGARAEDYKALIRIIKNKVLERFGVTLEEEVEFL